MKQPPALAVSKPTKSGFAAGLPLPGGWICVITLITALTLSPVAVLVSSLLAPERDIWMHFVEYQLPQLLTNTFLLVLGVGLSVAVIGIALAWLTAVCDFPGRKQFSWALLLPLAIPAYVTAFVAIGLLDFTGPIQTFTREYWGPIKFPEIRSGGGVIAVMTLALYPYVYLVARNAFLTQGKHAIEVAQSLGFSPTIGFFRVALPMARPWIVGGVMLALMEVLADFGTVAAFNYDTFTTAIYKAWFSLFSLQAASQLASLLIIFVLIVVMAEQQTRTRVRYNQVGRHSVQNRIQLTGKRAWLATTFCSAILIFGFIVPVIQLLLWASEVVRQDLDERYFNFLAHSLMLGFLASLLVVMAALFLSYGVRQKTNWMLRMMVRIATIGYALPGAVLAVGIFIPVAWLDNKLVTAGWIQAPLLEGSLLVMLLAYLIRFLAVAHNPIDSQMHRITRSMDEAARSLGVTATQLIALVHVPMLRAGLITGAALVFVDVIKEMPITLMTRPFGWDTLAVRVFEMTSAGEWNRAALPAVALILAGLVPIFVLTKFRLK